MKGHIRLFEAAFAGYKIEADEMTAEGNCIVVRAHCIVCHKGEFSEVSPKYRNVNMPFVISYEIENEKIAHHWIIGDVTILMEQLGVMSLTA